MITMRSNLLARRIMAQASPKQAELTFGFARRVISSSVKHGQLEHNQLKGIDAAYEADRSERIWTHEQVDAACGLSLKRYWAAPSMAALQSGANLSLLDSRQALILPLPRGSEAQNLSISALQAARRCPFPWASAGEPRNGAANITMRAILLFICI
jgi:hypothetical protein